MTSRADYYTSTDKKEELYSDFLVDLNPHPEAKDIVRFVNENAVKRAIRNLILTDHYERLCQPRIGSNIRRMLFEPMNSATAEIIGNMIRETIATHEKRCKLIEVVVTPYEDRNLYAVTVIFAITNKQEPISLNITLYRVR